MSYLSNRKCSIVKQMQTDHNLIEVLPTGTCFDIEEKRFVCDPLGESDIEKITPRAFVRYTITHTVKKGVIPHSKIFIDGIENSFGRRTDECKDFLRKYYQLLFPGKFPQKIKKLCLICHFDSGKTSWFQPFQAIVPLPFIAAIIREGQFSAHKLSPDPEICYINEWYWFRRCQKGPGGWHTVHSTTESLTTTRTVSILVLCTTTSMPNKAWSMSDLDFADSQCTSSTI